MASKKALLKSQVDERAVVVNRAEKEVAAAEAQVQELRAKAKEDAFEDMISIAKLTEVMVETAKSSVKDSKEQLESLNDGAVGDLKNWLVTETKLLGVRLGRMEARLLRVETISKQFRGEATKRKSSELDRLKRIAAKVIRYNQMHRRHPTLRDLFDEIDSKADGQLDEEEFLAFFQAAEMVIRDLEIPTEAADEAPLAEEETKDPAASEDASGAESAEAAKEPTDEKKASVAIRRAIQKLRVATPDTFDQLHVEFEEIVKHQLENTGSQKESMQAEINKGVDLARKRVERLRAEREAKEQETATAEVASGPLEPREETLELPAAGIGRLFKHLSAESNGFITREAFFQLARIFMRVVKEVPLTHGSGTCKTSEVLRMLAAKEVVEVLHGPMRDPATGSVRIEARTFKDTRQGWATVVDAKASFIKEGGQMFKVVKETILTAVFDLELTQSQTSNLMKQSKRKLKVGEILEALTWPVKDQKSGLMRMQVRALNDDLVGFATTVGNQGAVFIDLY